MRLAVLLLCIAGARFPELHAMNLTEHAARLRGQLSTQILPYWFDTTIDRVNGGYILADNGQQVGGGAEKQLVSQSRLIWTFSHVHLKGLSDDQRNYLQAAEHGYRFLRTHFLDPQHGGYYWKTDLAGKVLNDHKIIYGQAFVIYALLEYHRASGDPEALRLALDLFFTLERQSRDKQQGGWIEHFRRDWRPILSPTPGVEVEIPGLKSANTHLHLMEALTELYRATADFEVRDALTEALRLNSQYFYPFVASQSCFHRQLDWEPVRDPASAGLSYGHNVEFAWLMIQAEVALGRKPSWKHLYAHIDHALKYGFDHRRGGLYNRGVSDQPASQLDKVWWVQAEWLAALTEALAHHRQGHFDAALQQHLNFVQEYMADRRDAVWMDTVNADGTPKNTAKAHNWKANYHDVRAIVKFLDAFPSHRGVASR